MHDPAINGNGESGQHQRGKSSGSRKCNCCPYGYHLDLDFVRYCEKVANSQLLQSARHTIPRIRAGRKKRESIESLLGIALPQPQQSQINTDTWKSRPEETTDEVLSDALEKAVSDFEKMLQSSSRTKSADDPPFENICNVTINLKSASLGEKKVKTADPFEDSKLFINGANNASAVILQEIRQQMAASLNRTRQLEEEVKLIPNLQVNPCQEKIVKEAIEMATYPNNFNREDGFKSNKLKKPGIPPRQKPILNKNQIKKLRWENRRLTKLIESKSETYERNLKDLRKGNEMKDDGVRHTRTIGTSCSVLRRDVAVSKQVPLTSTGTDPPPPDLSRLINRETNTDFPCDKTPEKSLKETKPVVKKIVTYNTSCQTIPWPIKPITLQCGIQTDSTHQNTSITVPSANIDDTHSKFSPSSVYNCALSSLHKYAEYTDTGTQPENVPAVNVGTQYEFTSSTAHIPSNVRSKFMSLDECIEHHNKQNQKVPTVDISIQHDVPVISTSNLCSSQTSSYSYIPEITKDISTRSAATQYENRPDIIPASKNVSTQVVLDTKLDKRKDFGTQVKPLMSDAMIDAKLQVADNSTQTQRNLRKDIGIYVNTLTPRATSCVGVNTESKKTDVPGKVLLISKLSDTHDLCRKTDACVEAKANLVNASVDTNGLKVHRKKERDIKENKMVVSPNTRKQHLYTSHTLQPLKKNEEVSITKGMHENISPTASIISKPYEKKEPSKEMKGAMKVLNDSLLKSPSGEMPKSMRNAVNIIQQEWFKVSSTADANPLDVEDYLDCFEELSVGLLEYIVNMTDVSGNTAMHYAVSNGNFDVVSILLDSKVCNINKLNTAGYTCIMLVALTKVKSETDRQVVRRLFHMADVNIRAKQHGQTALMLAVSHGRIDTVELLLESGADINIQDEDGSTALMCAAEHGYIDIVKLLLAQPDCDLAITDLDGNTALNIAMEAGNRDIGVLLYAQEHFSRGNSPFSTLKSRRAKSSTPTLKTRTPTPPNCSHEHSL